MFHKSQKRDKKKEQIVDIIVNSLLTDKKLPSEKELMKDLNVSRSGLRELLAEFEASGIIVATQGKGREVQLPNISDSIVGGWNILLRARPETLLELLDVRHKLETGYLSDAIYTLKLQDLQLMRDLINRMEAKAKRNEIFTEEDQYFHRILYSRINNMLLDQLLNSFWKIFHQMSEYHRSENLINAADIHKKIYEAIVIQDIEKARKLMGIQFEDVRKRIEKSIRKNNLHN